jgi:sulfur-oxidizing protein SoxY
MTTDIDMPGRRDALRTLGAGAFVVAGGSLFSGAAAASSSKAEEALKKLTGGKTAKTGRVHLKLPPIAENGNTVPLTVTVDSPMTEKDYVKAVHIVADGNPRPDVATFHFSPMSGKPQVGTRIRMAKTQNIIAVAEMSDGTLYRASKNVKVTIGGCGG